MSEQHNRVERAIREHVAAFNAHDLPRLLSGLAEDAVWQTGQDTIRGREALAALFGGAFSAIAPQLAIHSLLVDQERAACELEERMTVAGAPSAPTVLAVLVVLGAANRCRDHC